MKILGSRTIKKIFSPLNRLGIILMYHRVAHSDYDPLYLSVRPKHFEEQMQVIKKYARCIQIKLMGKNLKRFPKGKIDIAVTFDDGYADNFYNAKPILERFEIPATFFITTGYIDGQEEFFWDRFTSFILAPENLPKVFEATIADQIYRWEIESSGPCQFADYSKPLSGIPSKDSKLTRFRLYSALLEIFTFLSDEQKRDVLRQLVQWSARSLPERKEYFPMTWSDLNSLANCPLFEIGAHTVNHPKLASLSIQKQEEEIDQSKADLENRLDKQVISFSYPHGNYNEETVKILNRLKFQSACTVVPNQVMRGVDPYLLPRFSVGDWDGDEFEKNLRQWLK